MGCDIHPYIEQRINGKWTLLRKQPTRHGRKFDLPSIYDRNYNVFAILADVRNGHGFAGVKTSEGFKPIHAPRGLPDDLSDELNRDYPEDDEDAPWLGDHSFSWLGFREIFDYDYSQITTLCGVVSAQEFFDWDWSDYSRERGPKSWSGAVFGRSIRHVTVEEMRRRLAPLRESREPLPKEFRDLYTQIEWQRSYFDCAWRFLYALKWDAPEGVNYDDLRLVDS